MKIKILSALASFFAGTFLVNGIPHFFHGISGNMFPTPFAEPPAVGLSPALLNTIWGLLNFALGVILLRPAKLRDKNKLNVTLFIIACIAMSISLSILFSGKMTN